MEPMIEIKNLSVSFERTVIRDFSLSLRTCGVTWLKGPSGAGKTTVLNAIASLIPYSGTITLAGRVAYLFQEDRLLAHLSAEQNVRLTAQSAEKAEYYMRAFGVDTFADKRPAALSGGMARRTALARCFAFGGDIFLLDEPFRGLDEDNALLVRDEIVRLAQSAIVLLVSHETDVDFAARTVFLPLLQDESRLSTSESVST